MLPETAIAVIGMAGRFPSANNIQEFHQLLQSGREGLRDLSLDELKQAGVSDALLSHPDYIRRCGAIDRKAVFDAPLFGYSAREAALLNPQLCVLHECAWDALEHAGYTSDKYAGSIGVYAGGSNNITWLQRILAVYGAMPEGALLDMGLASMRIAYQLNLTGPAFNVQTACSTSLVAIHLAYQGLNVGDCDIALAGGVSAISLNRAGYLYQEGMPLSSDGACRTFDADASGTVFSEGCGLLVLKRLSAAQRDRDTVLAVICGSAINNDGHRKATFTAPGIDGQAAVIKAAQRRAGVSPDSISYIEAHGTATKLGDPIEIEALTAAFDLPEKGTCRIGSVKSAIGHLDAAAGVAGMIKTVLSLQHKQLYPSLHFKKPNPQIDFDNSPFSMNTRLCDWVPPNQTPRRAGVSSFGIGGTNAHMIVEESRVPAKTQASRTLHMVFLSANSPAALEKRRADLLHYLQQTDDLSAADLCYTLHVGRKDLPYRHAFVIRNRKQLMATLDNTAENPGYYGNITLPHRKVCLLFPGQGSQYLNMGKTLYQQEPAFRRLMDECFSIAKARSGVDYKVYLFPPQPSVAAEKRLHQTANTQPLLFIFEYALARLLIQWGCHPNALIGHSIGEYVAACLAGVFTVEDALSMVIQRGRLMQSLPAGSMLSVLSTETEIGPLLSEQLSIAAINSPERLVISGDTAAIIALQEIREQRQIPHKKLHTSHAFHSQHMEPILADFQAFLEKITFSPPKIPFVSNTTGQWIKTAQAISAAYWAQQLRQPVQFSRGIRFLCEQNRQLFVEVGPGKGLSAFVAQTADKRQGHVSVPLLPERTDSLSDQEQLFSSFCQLFVAGATFNWEAFYSEERCGRIPLPTYPFEGQCYYAPELLHADAEAAYPTDNRSQEDALRQNRNPNAGCEVKKPILADTEPDIVKQQDLVKHARSDVIGEYSPPTNAIEKKLAALWADFLGLDKVGIQDNLFEFGLDSLSAVQVIGKIRQAFTIEFPLDYLLEQPRIKRQAELISLCQTEKLLV